MVKMIGDTRPKDQDFHEWGGIPREDKQEATAREIRDSPSRLPRSQTPDKIPQIFSCTPTPRHVTSRGDFIGLRRITFPSCEACIARTSHPCSRGTAEANLAVGYPRYLHSSLSRKLGNSRPGARPLTVHNLRRRGRQKSKKKEKRKKIGRLAFSWLTSLFFFFLFFFFRLSATTVGNLDIWSSNELVG